MRGLIDTCTFLWFIAGENLPILTGDRLFNDYPIEQLW